ncbi:MAG TPA: class I SAM-dependent methyltransferase [Candidatus Wunengus sp. YC60]|uniref:class I SAM-dependent methyltransferase n=1 Tax=Candidatus Wunengus sp. YC60 TaxID=3367697 RepID=UPI004029F2A2
MEHTIQYIKTFCKDKGIASITPSSAFAVKRICSKIDFTKDNILVECGPGNGVFSFAILRHMPPGSRLILIESNKDFVRYLDNRIHDPRVSVFHDNAINIQSVANQCGVNTVDYVILGIPFSLSDHEQNHAIIANCKTVLKKGGKLLVYQFSPRIRRYLKQHFESIRYDVEIFNIPPLVIFEAF